MKERHSPTFKRCVIHIGTEKTGSTAIQAYLTENRAQLAKCGCIYPNPFEHSNSSLWEFAAIAKGRAWTQDMGRELGIVDSISQEKFELKLKSSLNKSFNNTSSNRVLIVSSEHLQSRLTQTHEIQKLKTFLENWVTDFQVIIYFRRQDQLALSLLATRIKSAADIELSDIIKTLNSVPKYYEYDQIFERWAAVFGLDAMKPRLFDPHNWRNRSLISDFCDVADIPQFPNTNTLPNRSLNKRGFHFLQILNKVYSKADLEMRSIDRNQLVNFISEKNSGKYYPISKNDAIKFYKQFSITNNRLKEIAFPDHEGALFNEDFSEYPDSAEPIEPDYRDAVQIALELWLSRNETLEKATVAPKRRFISKWFRI